MLFRDFHAHDLFCYMCGISLRDLAFAPFPGNLHCTFCIDKRYLFHAIPECVALILQSYEISSHTCCICSCAKGKKKSTTVQLIFRLYFSLILPYSYYLFICLSFCPSHFARPNIVYIVDRLFSISVLDYT